MAKYVGKPATINRPIGELYAQFSDMTRLKGTLEKGNPEQASKVGNVEVGEDYMAINNPQVGQIKFQVTERVEPSKVAFSAVQSPLPVSMSINLKEITPESTEVSTVLEMEIPMVMKALIGPKLQKVADQFGEMMTGGL